MPPQSMVRRAWASVLHRCFALGVDLRSRVIFRHRLGSLKRRGSLSFSVGVSGCIGDGAGDGGGHRRIATWRGSAAQRSAAQRSSRKKGGGEKEGGGGGREQQLAVLLSSKVSAKCLNLPARSRYSVRRPVEGSGSLSYDARLLRGRCPCLEFEEFT